MVKGQSSGLKRLFCHLALSSHDGLRHQVGMIPRILLFPALLMMCQCVGRSVPQGSQAGIPPYPQSAPLPATAAPAQTFVQASQPVVWKPDLPVKSQALAAGATHYEFQAHSSTEAADIEAVVFDTQHLTFKILDQPSSYAGSWAMSSLMREAGAVAGVNGGFFHPDFTPLGLMIADGRKTGTFTRTRLVSGAVLVSGTKPRLVWNHEFPEEQEVTQMLQAGPRLVDQGRPLTSLDKTKVATRTFVATDDGQRWVIGTVRSTSLAGLAELLASPGILPGIRVHRALNLDGGRSTALYARRADGTEISRTGWSTVRNYLAVVPR